MDRRRYLALLCASTFPVAGCLAESRCSNRTDLYIEFDPPPPPYRDELVPIRIDELPQEERAFVERSLRNGLATENERVEVCTDESDAARAFTQRVRSVLNDQGESPWGGAPKAYLLLDGEWYSINLSVNGSLVSH